MATNPRNAKWTEMENKIKGGTLGLGKKTLPVSKNVSIDFTQDQGLLKFF
jgi:hypothetical protein